MLEGCTYGYYKLADLYSIRSSTLTEQLTGRFGQTLKSVWDISSGVVIARCLNRELTRSSNTSCTCSLKSRGTITRSVDYRRACSYSQIRFDSCIWSTDVGRQHSCTELPS